MGGEKKPPPEHPEGQEQVLHLLRAFCEVNQDERFVFILSKSFDDGGFAYSAGALY